MKSEKENLHELFFASTMMRRNHLKEFIFDLFLNFCSLPRLVLEVFLRKNFGERYFSLAAAITVAVILAFFPTVVLGVKGAFGTSTLSSFLFFYLSWYLFIAAFLFYARKRWLEIRRNPSVFDFAKLSIYEGDIDSRFFSLKIFNKTPNVRTVEIWLEPALCFAVGLLLVMAMQWIGAVIMICSVFYCISYAGAYRNGDYKSMERIDKAILNQQKYDAFAKLLSPSKTKGVRFRGKLPHKEEDRIGLIDSLSDLDFESYTVR